MRGGVRIPPSLFRLRESRTNSKVRPLDAILIALKMHPQTKPTWRNWQTR